MSTKPNTQAAESANAIRTAIEKFESARVDKLMELGAKRDVLNGKIAALKLEIQKQLAAHRELVKRNPTPVKEMQACQAKVVSCDAEIKKHEAELAPITMEMIRAQNGDHKDIVSLRLAVDATIQNERNKGADAAMVRYRELIGPEIKQAVADLGLHVSRQTIAALILEAHGITA